MASFVMSLDGFIARPDCSVGPLFDWYNNGDVEVEMIGYPATFKMSQASAEYWTRNYAITGGTFVCGRKVFDYTHGWGGKPPLGGAAFVVSHRPAPDWPADNLAPFTFVPEGVESAVVQAKSAGNGFVGLSGASIVQQALNAGLVDEVRVDLVPVLLGEGVRYFEAIDRPGIRFTHLETVDGTGVTHLRYGVTYDS